MRSLIAVLGLLLPTRTAAFYLPNSRPLSRTLGRISIHNVARPRGHISMAVVNPRRTGGASMLTMPAGALVAASQRRGTVVSSLAVNTAVTATMLLVSIAKYMPQIRRILRSRSVLGLAPASYYGDSLVFCTKSMCGRVPPEPPPHRRLSRHDPSSRTPLTLPLLSLSLVLCVRRDAGTIFDVATLSRLGVSYW